MVDEGRDSDLVDAVVAKFQALRSRGAAFMLVVGSNTLAGNRVHKHYELSEALGMEFVGVLNIKGVKAEDVMHHVSSILSLMDEPHFHSLIINQIPKGTDMKELDAVLKKRDVEALALVPHSSDVEQAGRPSRPRLACLDLPFRRAAVRTGQLPLWRAFHNDVANPFPTATGEDGTFRAQIN